MELVVGQEEAPSTPCIRPIASTLPERSLRQEQGYAVEFGPSMYIGGPGDNSTSYLFCSAKGMTQEYFTRLVKKA